MRALLRLKRKSDPDKDRNDDGARAVIAEEGIANWLFSVSESHRHFQDARSLDFKTLRIVKDMTQNYEVRNAPYWMWEEAILEGFRVFRELKAHRGGTVTIDLKKRTISYAKPDWTD